MYMSQAFAEIRHFRKCLDFPQLPRHLQKMVFISMLKFWEMAQYQKKYYFKTKLGYPNLT